MKILGFLFLFHCFSLSALAFDFVPLFSYVVPGSIEVYEGKYLQGLSTIAVAAGLNANIDSKDDKEEKLYLSDTSDETSTTNVPSKGGLELDTSRTYFAGVQMMSAYNAYRIRGGHDEEYSNLLIAPFNPNEIFRPVSIASLLIAGGLLLRANEDYKYKWSGNVKRTDMNVYNFSRFAYAPAVSEEMFFRGYLNTELSKTFSPWIGVPLSALLFAAVHEGQGIQANSMVAGAAGLGLGILQVSNDFKISQGIALHFWVNFLVGLKAIENGERVDDLLSLSMSF
ncbi:MAG: CPBP family intramembrane glutamic endopeptidase [Bdellovibrionota bacterium]|nr:CPBP family intramembrane glutamic endopeptidase [Bdellovibrionota bacterium]